MKIKHTFLTTFFIINILFSWSQDIAFHHLTTDDGLSQISVKALYEDERGFIWAGTRDGLNLYNGNGIQSFKHEKNHPNSIISNRVEKIVGDRNGKIFLRCANEVMEYDFKSEKFTPLLLGDVSTIYFNQDLLVGRANSILIQDKEKGGFKPFYTLPKQQAKVSCIFQNGTELLIGTSNMGLFVIKNKVLSQPMLTENVSSILKDSKGFFWIGTDRNGLYQLKGNTIKNFKNIPGNSKSLSSDIVRDCCEDEQGNIWIATFNGLNKFNRATTSFVNYTASSKPDGLTHSSINSLLKDHQGSIWVGTYFGGINYFNPEYDIYTFYKAVGIESQGISYPVVGKMLEDRSGNLWICTEGGGLNMFNPQTGLFKWYKHGDNANGISHNTVKSLYYDEKGEIIWIGLHLGGLDKLDLKTGRFTNYSSILNNPNSLPNNIVRDIVPYKNELIVATENGVCLFSPLTGQCRQLFKDVKGGKAIKIVTDLLFDHQGKLWLTAEGEGAFSYSFETNKLTNYKHNQAVESSIGYNDINSLYEDSRHNLWFCTSGNGLDLYHVAKDEFEHFDTENSTLTSNCIFQICESTPGILLGITNQGFFRFDIAKNTFDNFNKKNGFPLSSIVTSSLYLSRSGTVYLGGVQGLVSFREKDLYKKIRPYSIYPSRLLVNDTEVKVNDETGILESALYCLPKISLPSKYNVFAIEFATSNYITASKGEIVYKLEGFSDTWISTRGQHTITYTNLNSGNYTLVVKEKDSKSNSVPEYRLEIRVQPPFYRSTLAYLLYIIIIVVIFYYVQRANNAKIVLEESLKYEQKRIHDVELINKGKLDFFTNISHEFRTPLTLIIGQMEMLLQLKTFTPIVYNKMLGVYKNGLQLRELITELLDFRKQEQGMMKIKVTEHDLVSFVYENYLLFLEFANSRKVKFSFVREVEVLHVWFDAKQMQKVINNLLSNAFKYTQEGAKITVTIKQVNQQALIEVIDEGVGMSAEELSRIFDPFYQAHQSEVLEQVGTGIGLALTKGILELHHGTITVESEKGKGTKFSCRLKMGIEHFDAGEVIKEEDFVVAENEVVKIDPDFYLEQDLIETAENKKKEQKILIVEDNLALREMLVSLFEPFYEVVTAVDGVDGVEKVKLEQPNIVLSDVMMPKMFGTELCKRVKEDIDTCHIPVVLLTARTTVDQNLEGLRIGADDYITKPFNNSVLVTRCNNLVNSRVVLQEKFSKQPQMTPRMLATNNLDKVCMDKIMSIVEKYIADTAFDVNVFASEMGMSRTALFGKIKGITGQTPNDFITTIRIKKAAFMLQNSLEMNITEISEALGFNSSRYFSKCFKTQYHVSPLSYRKGLTSDEEEEL